MELGLGISSLDPRALLALQVKELGYRPLGSSQAVIMKKVDLNDIMGIAGYAKLRESLRQRIIALKKYRRVAVGNQVSLVFENRDTVIFQIHEMLRAEHITDLDKIREELEVYNGLIPEAGELSATLFLEIEDQTHLREELLKFLGIDEAVSLRVGSHKIRARFEEGRSKEDKISAVQYVKFPFTPAALSSFVGAEEAELQIDHPGYQARIVLAPETRKSLIADLTALH